MMKLSIAMIVKNEEKYLEQCLSSLKPIMNSLESELIIVDTGSEDKTVEIAKKFTNKVYFHEWNNDFASMRNITISYAKGEWILILDGDEIIEIPDGIIDFLNSDKSEKFNTGMITIRNIVKENDISINSGFLAMRLFKNNNFKYEGKIHEIPKYQLPVHEIDSLILHYGYLTTDYELMEYKFQRNTKLLIDELEKNPEDIYYWYQLSSSYGMYNEPKKALEAILKAYEIAKKNKINLQERMYVYTNLVIIYALNNKYVELEKICLEAIKTKDQYLDFYFYLGKAQKELKKDQEAIRSYQTYLKRLSQRNESNLAREYFVTDITTGQYENVYLDLCILYQRQGDMEEALKYANKIASKNIYRLSIPHIIEIYLCLNRYDDLKEYYCREILEKNEDISQEFWIHLEKSIENFEENEKYKVIDLFSKGDCEYSLLNRIRLYLEKDTGENTDELIEKIKLIDFQPLSVFFADFIYFLMLKCVPLEEILHNIRDDKLHGYINYLANKYRGFSKVVLKYLDNTIKNNELIQIRINKVLEKSILILNAITTEKLKYVWGRYIEDGVNYITKLYSQEVIENELIYDVKNDEDAFLVYMLLANRNKNKDKLQYIQYLKKALKVFPIMNRGIELLLESIEENEQKASSDKLNEFEELKEKVKNNIKILLAQNQAMEAKTIVDEYLKIVPNDLEMLLLKSEVHLKIV